jgi:hypothetical protein
MKSTFVRGPSMGLGQLCTLAGVLVLLSHLSAVAQTAVVLGMNDGKAAENSEATGDIFTQTLISGYSGNHTVQWGALWGGTGPLALPQVEPCPPTDFYASTSYVASQWNGGSNLLGEAHASRLTEMAMLLELDAMESTLQGLPTSSSSSSGASTAFVSVVVTGTTWGTAWTSNTIPWTLRDSANLYGCYQCELWIFGALVMLPIILKVRPG